MAVHISRRTSNDGDVAVTVRYEMLHDGAYASSVVDVDGVERCSLDSAVEENHRMRVGEVGHEGLGIDVGGHDDDAIDSAPHGTHRTFDLALIVMGIGDDEVIAGAASRDIDAANDFGEEFAVEVGKEDSNGAGATGNEASGAAVRDVMELCGNVANPPAGFVADRAAAIEDARDSGH